MSINKVTVTFDSNVWEEIVLPEKLEEHRLKNDLRIIKDAITKKVIEPYISDVTMIWEAIKKLDREKVIKTFSVSKKIEDHGLQSTGQGTLPIHAISVTLTAKFELPALNIHVTEAFNAAHKMGFKLIHAKRNAFPKVEAEFYKPYTTSHDPSKKDIFGAFKKANVGSAQAEKLGEEVKKKEKDLGGLPPLIAFTYDKKASIPKLVAEWADGDALIAHYEHGHDYFCTLDEGKNAGTQSVLHSSRRNWLCTEFGIKIVSPAELAQIVCQ